MPLISKVEVSKGIYWVEVSEVGLYILCGCPADSVKHLMKRGLILNKEQNGVKYESGPNAILLSDVMLQNGNFANMAEFPVLQMLYRQGMILPNHPNNTGKKPLLIGSSEQVNTQMNYIYRGNYGLTSEKEIIESGVSKEVAQELMRMKLKFAFGKIHDSNDFLDSAIVGEERIEIRDEVFIERKRVNIFEISYKGEKVTVDLNLKPKENYEAPYKLGFYDIKREYFSIIHSGQGDGWDIYRPTMSTVLVYQGKIYLIDAGPNIAYTLSALGIGINEIEGIFHTHAHDDHFAGITTLIRADHKIKYFATPLVRASVMKKLSALLSMDEDKFSDFFEIYDLICDEDNDIDGLEVKPIFSPHPVETSIFIFKTLGKGGYKSYAHFADIVSLSTLEGMITEDSDEIGVSSKLFEKVKEDYLQEVDLKKIDIGGGLIHGNAEDFKDDNSTKIVLAHTSFDLTQREKEIGSGAPFGAVDVLIPVNRDYAWRYAHEFLHCYFPQTPISQIRVLLNCDIVTFNPDTILIKEGERNQNIYLILTGTIEVIQTKSNVYNLVSAGSLIGEVSGLISIPSMETYRALSYVQVLELPSELYLEFVKKNHLYANIEKLKDNREFLQKTWLFGEETSYPIQNRISQNMKKVNFKKGHTFDGEGKRIFLISKGSVEAILGDNLAEILREGDFFGEDSAIFDTPPLFKFKAIEDLELFAIEGELIKDIPIVRWKLIEKREKRKNIILKLNFQEKIFDWNDNYSVNIQKIDEEHKELFKLTQNLYKLIREREDKSGMQEALIKLIDYTKFHFSEEEKLLQNYNYSDFKIHSKKHIRLLNQLSELSDDLSHEVIKENEVLKFLQGWIINHILEEDRKYSEFLNSNGVF